MSHKAPILDPDASFVAGELLGVRMTAPRQADRGPEESIDDHRARLVRRGAESRRLPDDVVNRRTPRG